MKKKKECAAFALLAGALVLAGCAAVAPDQPILAAQTRECNQQGQDCKIDVIVTEAATGGGCTGRVEDAAQAVIVTFANTPVVWQIRGPAHYEFFGAEIGFKPQTPNDGYLVQQPSPDRKKSIWLTTRKPTPLSAPLQYAPVVRRASDQMPCTFADPLISNMGR
jgi:hypothetical protein